MLYTKFWVLEQYGPRASADKAGALILIIFLLYFLCVFTLSGPKIFIFNSCECSVMLNGGGIVGTKIYVVLFFCQIILGHVCCCCGSLLVNSGCMANMFADSFNFLGCHIHCSLVV